VVMLDIQSKKLLVLTPLARFFGGPTDFFCGIFFLAACC
jgi:hypothetical protein